MITEDDDDTHICLKCHTTITGLDSYVSHRKAGCRTQAAEHNKPRTLSPLMPPDEPDFALKADDFFSLLELQSSSKKSTLQVPSTGKSNSGVLTRSKATAVLQASNLNRASDWIGGHQLRELGNEDNQTKLINAVDNISGNQIKKDEPARLTYAEELDTSNDEYEEDEEDFDEVECHNVPPRSHTGGKWKPSVSPIQWLRPSSAHSDRGDWDTPPPSHTGGKWKPMPPYVEDDDDKNAPPPDHTKGKWIPGRNNSLDEQTIEEIPPLRKSSGTVQYWCGPCNRRLASKVVYDRHLRSELHYKRTLHEREFENSSDYLHQKTHKRAEGKREIKKPEHLWLNVEHKKNPNDIKPGRGKKQLFVRCEVCRSKVLTHLMGKHLISHYHCRKRNILKSVAQLMVLDNILSIVQQAPFQCSTCRFFCNHHVDFMQHWRSASHVSTTMHLDGYFICSFCKFQCKSNKSMETHLLSETHTEVVSVINRSVPIIIRMILPITCVTCSKEFRYNVELRKHCVKENHVLADTSSNLYQDKYYCSECSLVLKTNKSLQRHLYRRHGKNYFFCSLCCLTFETYLESKLHRQGQQHKYAVLTKNYERGFSTKDISRVCQYCCLRFSNTLVLKDHLRKEHPEHTYSCPKCGLKFTLSQEVTRHIKAKACSFAAGPSAAYFSCAKCPFKTNSEGDFLFHEALHTEPISVYDAHAETLGNNSKKPAPFIQYKCPVCDKLFRKSSLRCHIRQHTNERPFKCHICKAAYARKSNLTDHIRFNHKHGASEVTTEQLVEEHSYDQRSQLQDHIQLVHNTDVDDDKGDKKDEQEPPPSNETREKRFLCSFCGKSFLKKFTLVQHAKVHTGKSASCPHEGCVYRARSAAELKPHLATHSDLRPFACPHCDFRTKTKTQLVRHGKIHSEADAKKYACSLCPFAARMASQLRRHMRLHTGAKPYRCPHCTYSCNILENLRKHVLSTNKHPGKRIYECQFCEEPNEFATNFAKELRVHLITTHPDRFESLKEAASYVVGIYSAEEDTKLVQTQLEPSVLKHNASKPVKAAKEKPEPKTNRLVKCDLPISSTAASTSRATSRILLTAAADQDSNQRTAMDSELLAMVVVANPRDEIIYVEMPSAGTDAWTMEGYYDVEESGNLVPFLS